MTETPLVMKQAILGLDAAWTSSGSSGVALIARPEGGRWTYIDSASSYQSFIRKVPGVDGSLGTYQTLVKVASQLLDGAQVTVVAVDMPLSKSRITGRRAADDCISKAFSTYWCAAHSPTSQRPGNVSVNLMKALRTLGYDLAVDGGRPGNALVEVYPHPAIVRLLNLPKRLEYKVDRRHRYWGKLNLTSQQKKDRLLQAFSQIHTGLAGHITNIPADLLPAVPFNGTFVKLKSYEDTLDALVCAWVGACYSDGQATAYGDAKTNAIWVP